MNDAWIENQRGGAAPKNMAKWNELFAEELHIARVPESEVYKFVAYLQKLFTERPLRLWDNGCGAGRHAVAMALLGHEVYASDNAPRGLELTRQWLDERELQAKVAEADMTTCPWPDVSFHGVMSWDVLHHNTLGNIRKAINVIYDRLVPGGLLLATLKSDKADLYGQGKEIEPGTFVLEVGAETGVPHHYFDEKGIRDLFHGWEFKALVEQVITNVDRPERFWEYTPFPHTTWGVLARKPE